MVLCYENYSLINILVNNVPHKGNIVKIYYFSYYTSDPASTNNVPYLRKSVIHYEDVGVGLLKDSTLMGNFTISPPNMPHTIDNINMITSSTITFDDPLIVTLEYELDYYDNEMPLSPYELEYVTVQSLDTF